MRLVTTLATVAAAATVAAITAATAAAAETTAATAAAAEATTATAAAEGATSALFFWTSFIDGELMTTEIGAVHFFRGVFRLLGRAHGDESETAGAAGNLDNGDV